MEPTVRERTTETVDRVATVLREHVAGMADWEASVVRVERAGLLEVEDEVEQADEDAEDLVDLRGRKSHLFPLLWHIPVDVQDRWGRMS